MHRIVVSSLVALCTLALAHVACAAPAAPAKTGKSPVVVMKTSLGSVKIELNQEKAPISVANFLKYVDAKHYDGTVFHRVIANFMIQGGGFDKSLVEKKTNPPIENESKNGLKNVRGSIAMARTSVPNSATSQFYINVKDNPNLDYPSFDGVGYAVFGTVVEGMDVVDKIRNVKTGAKGPFGSDVPQETVVIESVRREK
jgi:cyclophilin family peptidyl-prolyl cis-trans isomerase